MNKKFILITDEKNYKKFMRKEESELFEIENEQITNHINKGWLYFYRKYLLERFLKFLDTIVLKNGKYQWMSISFEIFDAPNENSALLRLYL